MPGPETAFLRRGPLEAVGFAVALVVAATLLGCLTWDGEGLVTPASWLVAAIVGTSVFAGFTAGLSAAFAGTLALMVVFTDPRWSIRIADDGDTRATAAFAALALLVALAIDAIDAARRRADRALAEHQEAVALLDAVLEHAPVGIAFFDTELRFVRVNECLLELNGLPLDALLGRRLGEALDDDAVEDVARRALRTGRPVLDVRFGGSHRTTGEPLHVVASYYPVRDDSGAVAGVGVVVHDTSGQVEADRERERLFERLARLQSATAALAAAGTTDEVVAAVLAEVRLAAGGSAASLALREGDEVRVLAGDGYDEATLARWGRFPLDGDVPLAEAIRTGELVVAASRAEIARRWPSTAPSLPERERAIAAVPLVLDGVGVGAIGLSVDGVRDWDDAERGFLLTLATQCSQALRRARLVDSERRARDRLAFLADATLALASTLDLDEALRRLCELVVPRLAQRCEVRLGEPEPPEHEGEAVLPMRAGERVVGALRLAGPLGPDDLALAEEVAARAAQTVLNAELFRERDHVADVLQRSLLPPAAAGIPGLDVATRFVPVGEGIDVGGDFYDVFRLGRPRSPWDTWAVVVGDVRGKGAEAAAITGAARHAVRTAGLRTRSPAALLGELNEVLLVQAAERPDDPEPMFCTAVVASVTPGDHGARVVVGNGGHPAALLLQADGTTVEVGAPGSLLGVVDDPLLQDVEVDLGPGEALVLYTDGVTERHAGDRFFDEDGLAAAVSRCAGFTADALAERIELAARAFVEDAPVDDIAIVVVRAPTRTATSSSASTDLPVGTEAPRLARRFVAEVLDAIGRADLLDSGELLTSEVVTNAVLHGAPPLRVSVEPGEGRVRVVVTDGGAGRPELVEADRGALRGRGILLVENVAERWGVEELPGGAGKSVWFDLA